MTTIDLETLVLEHGSHASPDDGMCVMEAVAYVAGEPFSDHPKCASRVLTNFLIGLNDRWSNDDRQLLKPFIPRLVGTNTGENDEETRRWMIADWLVHEYAPAIFRHVGLTAEAEEFEQFAAVTSASVWTTIRTRIYAVREKRRTEARERLRADAAAVAAGVAAGVADAAAAAVAAAVADAAADGAAAGAAAGVAAAAAVAAAVAAGVAAADADGAAVAAAVAAGVAAAVAAGVAAADAAGVADAAADGAADAAAGRPLKDAIAAAVKAKKNGAGYSGQYQAAYNVLRPFYNERYSKVFNGELGLKQSALQLVDRLIEVGKPE